jgi:HEAT repeat protein
MVNHLKHHPHPLVAENATLLVGRRIRNLGWVKQRLASTDARIRSAAVEGLWGSDTPSARVLLRQSGRDESSRVVANALLGLHILGETGAHQSVIDMACDQRPSFRRSAVWAMRQMGEPAFLEPLRTAMADTEAEVRLGAKQALATIRKLAIAKNALELPAPAAKAALPVEPETAQPMAFGFKFDGSPKRE